MGNDLATGLRLAKKIVEAAVAALRRIDQFVSLNLLRQILGRPYDAFLRVFL